jgi:hypothetical protein
MNSQMTQVEVNVLAQYTAEELKVMEQESAENQAELDNNYEESVRSYYASRGYSNIY